MKPPTTEALRYAATVLGRELTQLERMQKGIGPAAQEQLDMMLAQVRSVRTWILGVQMPNAQRREAKLFRLARSGPFTDIGSCTCEARGMLHPGTRHARDCPLRTEPERTPCTECGELLAFDHSVCFYCATGTRPATNCTDCGATLMHVVGPNVNGVVCPHCTPDSSLLDDEDDSHEPDCRCSECADHPLTAEESKMLATSVVGLVKAQDEKLEAMADKFARIFGLPRDNK